MAAGDPKEGSSLFAAGDLSEERSIFAAGDAKEERACFTVALKEERASLLAAARDLGFAGFPSAANKMTIRVESINMLLALYDATTGSSSLSQEKLTVKLECDNGSTNWGKTGSSAGESVTSHPKHTDPKDKLKMMEEEFANHLTNQEQKTGSCASTSKNLDPKEESALFAAGDLSEEHSIFAAGEAKEERAIFTVALKEERASLLAAARDLGFAGFPSAANLMKIRVEGIDMLLAMYDDTTGSSSLSQDKLKLMVDEFVNYSTNQKEKTGSCASSSSSYHLKNTDPKDKLKLMVEVFISHLTNQEQKTGSCARASNSSHSKNVDPKAAAGIELIGTKLDEDKDPSTSMLVMGVQQEPRVEEVPTELPKSGAANISTPTADLDIMSPFLSAAQNEATKAIAKIEQLSQSAMELKLLGVKPTKLTKAAKWASDALDKRLLSEHIEAIEEAKKEGNNCNLISPPPLLQFRINTNTPKNVVLSHLSGRRQLTRPGIDLVSWKGSFAVPRSLMSGNRYIDQMNLVLFGIYMSVQDLLEGAHMATRLAKLGLQVPRSKDEEDDCKAAIRKLRTTAHNIQVSIVRVGGLPLREPALYWREAFPDVTLHSSFRL